MTVRFHPPQDQGAYADRVLTILVQAAMPHAVEQLERSHRQETQKPAAPNMQRNTNRR